MVLPASGDIGQVTGSNLFRMLLSSPHPKFKRTICSYIGGSICPGPSPQTHCLYDSTNRETHTAYVPPRTHLPPPDCQPPGLCMLYLKKWSKRIYLGYIYDISAHYTNRFYLDINLLKLIIPSNTCIMKPMM